MNNFNGLAFINIELTSRCNKNCHMCGRRKIDREYPEIATKYGDMEFSLLEKIAKQVPPNIVVAFHWNGDPTLYPRLGEAFDLFPNNIKCLDTNGKLLIKKKNEIIDKIDSLTLSVIENDPDGDKQYDIASKFLAMRGDKKPIVVFRLLGDVAKLDNNPPGLSRKNRWYDLAKMYDCIIATRTLHSPMGSFKYERKPTIPEIGICVEALTHLAIDRFGYVSMCVRFDPYGAGIIGNVNTTPLIDIWNSIERTNRIDLHKQGRRKDIPLCAHCDFWGVPTAF